MVVLFYLLISLVHATIAQFPTHLDLQKVGEIIFNNEKHNVLKPTVHKITDHFKDFILRRENVQKNEKIFVDDNGFRHFWSGLRVVYKNLRKTGVSLYEINKKTQNDNKATDNKDNDDKTVTDATNNNVETTTIKAKKRPKRPKTSLEEEEAEKEALRQAAAGTQRPQSGAHAGRKVAKTSFFCPFFGVVTMTSFID